MTDSLLITYINKNILKKLEYLDLKFTPALDSPFIDVNIMKKTERTYRIVGMLTLAMYDPDSEEESPDNELKKINFTTKKKVQLDDHDPITLGWLEKGWIIKELRFKKDEKTVNSMHYRQGYRLYKYEEEQIQKKKHAIDQQIQNWNESAASFEYKLDQHLLANSKKGVLTLINMINEGDIQGYEELVNSPLFPLNWSIDKRLKFLHFITAFVQIANIKTNFDWKEIGASYYQVIGGSKVFDLYKEEFIAQLEDWAQCPADTLGLTSLGKITPLYFSGHIAGRFSTYQFGPVHALTDLAIVEDEYCTNTTILWLVENRSILTRMAAEKNFLKEANSLILCADGHLRTSHRKCIQQLVKNSSLSQVIIWSDYDPDGLIIARELYEAVTQVRSPHIKWITPQLDVITNWQQYEEHMVAFLKQQMVEQEQVLGGVSEWKKWIAH
ncbi:DUF2399 domain-containing protein [Brevibacillus reuszeri]|uniref:DUF2399 domain-containing protein n=1 Tax=Brevibacillus reuszeri TaxID=54915 RepID=UPI0028A149A3|nr:DUF2399 domain-containing protein [Brevibacillus reuszeri]